ncbi:hypothetical protein GGX14DRAFT_393496 [Mycena pura]|uniref:Uncharacterized protein n=1 Tax=Mycena pura TaxID=153505 RepID=A0AAD6VIL4_9AGAR|nr:hypothetical protein GGX14DRAFT_393496 [Mycena pura]
MPRNAPRCSRTLPGVRCCCPPMPGVTAASRHPGGGRTARRARLGARAAPCRCAARAAPRCTSVYELRTAAPTADRRAWTALCAAQCEVLKTAWQQRRRTAPRRIEMRRQRCRVSRGVALRACARSHNVERAHGATRGVEAAVRGFETERAAVRRGASRRWCWASKPKFRERTQRARAAQGGSDTGACARDSGVAGRRAAAQAAATPASTMGLRRQRGVSKTSPRTLRAAATLERASATRALPVAGQRRRRRRLRRRPWARTRCLFRGAPAPARGVENQGPSVGNGSACGVVGRCGASLDGGSTGYVENQGGGDAPSVGKRPVCGQRHGVLRDWRRGPVIDAWWAGSPLVQNLGSILQARNPLKEGGGDAITRGHIVSYAKAAPVRGEGHHFRPRRQGQLLARADAPSARGISGAPFSTHRNPYYVYVGASAAPLACESPSACSAPR